jgi:hypothetical protein
VLPQPLEDLATQKPGFNFPIAPTEESDDDHASVISRDKNDMGLGRGGPIRSWGRPEGSGQ